MNLKSLTLNHLALVLAILISNRSALSQAAPPQQQSDQWGLFKAHADVGDNPRKGAVTYNAANGEYRITGGGANIWDAVDAFQFVWKRFSGDVSISADVQFIGTGAVDHRKAVLMVRQSLDLVSPTPMSPCTAMVSLRCSTGLGRERKPWRSGQR
jgi:hypothetical protein